MARQNIEVNINDAAFQAALNRATGEGKPLGDLVAEFLVQYADGASAGSPTAYTIQRGDTLGRIAAKFYGDARKYPIIQRANNISNPSRIWVGQVLVIPPLAGSSTPAAPPPPTAAPPTSAPPPPPTACCARTICAVNSGSAAAHYAISGWHSGQTIYSMGGVAPF